MFTTGDVCRLIVFQCSRLSGSSLGTEGRGRRTPLCNHTQTVLFYIGNFVLRPDSIDEPQNLCVRLQVCRPKGMSTTISTKLIPDEYSNVTFYSGPI